jgi:molybdenum ABC transporter, periplasmic molybdate-binding protein
LEWRIHVFIALIATVLSLICYDYTSSYSLAAQGEIVVLAAASLKDAFREVGNLYEDRTGIKVYFNFSASGILQKQIEAGAPADVFASAGEKQMDALEGKGLIDKQTRSDFVRNTLVLVVPTDSKLNVRSFDDLDNPKLKRLAVGNPKTVPAGQYTQQLLTNMKLWQKLQPKLILAEDVRQVLDYVARGEVEAGIVYSSDVSIAQGKVSAVANAPEDLHDPILYPIAVIKESRQKESARRFVDLVLSTEGQNILRKYSFLSVK